ncbi:MAG: site-specific integrase [Rhodospirillaceae bacterium]
MTKITTGRVNQAEVASAEYMLWDNEIRGFGVRVRPTGRKAYIYKYRTLSGRQRKLTIGTHGDLTADEARHLARKAAAYVAEGGDPAADKADTRKAETVSELCDLYLEDHARPHKKPASVYNDSKMIDKYVKPKLGRSAVVSVENTDIRRIHQSISDKPYVANRVLALLSKMFNLAEEWGIKPLRTNPCYGVRKFKEAKRQRYLTSEELSRLGTALSETQIHTIDEQSSVDAIRLLLLTGCRKSEILTLQWEWVDFESACLRLPDSKTGAKTVPLGAPALRLLQAIYERRVSNFVIPGRHGRNHLINLRLPWLAVCKRADIQGVRLHDLRHTYASFAAGANLSLHVIGTLLGHTQTQTTQRYAHLAKGPAQLAADTIANGLEAALSGNTAQVIQLAKSC